MRPLFLINLFVVLSLAACEAPLPITPPSPQHKYADLKTASLNSTFSNARVYEGNLPCADCSNIHVRLELRPDYSYTRIETYQAGPKSKVFSTSGRFTLDKKQPAYIKLDKDTQGEIYILGKNYVDFANEQDKKAGNTFNYYRFEQVK
jgi:uncharacterized lipoprotein nlpE involved in copper resistance